MAHCVPRDMGAHAAPAVPICAGLLLGAGMGWWLEPGTGAVAAGVAATILVLVGRVRGLGLGLAIGWLGAALAVPGTELAPSFDTARPVEVVGRCVGRWTRSAYGWSSRLQISSLHQGARVGQGPRQVLITLPPGEVPSDGVRIRARGYLRRPNALRNGPERAPAMWRLAVKSNRLIETDPVPGWRVVLMAPRRAVESALARRRASPGVAVARALLLGDTSRLPSDWLLSLRNSGLGHLMAVSGLHVGLAMAIAWIACSGLRPRLRLVPPGMMVGVYLILVGGRASLLRSALMALIALSSLAMDRKPSSLNAWAVAVIAMVVASPTIVRSLGFQLTVAATLGLVTLAPVLRRRWARLPRLLGEGLSASLAAHVATLPWSLCIFHVWTPVAILLNLVAVPWMALTLGLAMAAVGLGWVPGLGEVIWMLMDLASHPFGWLATVPPGLFSGIPVTPSWSAALATTGALCVALLRPGVLTLSVATVALALVVLLPGPVAGLEVIVLDVGQGDAVLLRDGARALLVDGGGSVIPGIAARELVPALRRLGLRRLEGVVLSHPDLDHCAGLLELTMLIPVEWLRSAPGWQRACYRKLVLRRGPVLIPVWEGENWRMGRWWFDVLHPAAGSRGGGNDRSVVLRAAATGHSVLLTGDIGVVVETALINSGYELSSTVLKLGHHGSRNSNSLDFLARVMPRIAVVSSGRGNIYSHPSEEVVERLERLGIELYRTDLGGQIRLRFGATSEVLVEQPWALSNPTP